MDDKIEALDDKKKELYLNLTSTNTHPVVTTGARQSAHSSRRREKIKVPHRSNYDTVYGTRPVVPAEVVEDTKFDALSTVPREIQSLFHGESSSNVNRKTFSRSR